MKCDIVYFVKDCTTNEELRYSLRTVEKNFKEYDKIWFFGGKPYALIPDRYIRINQNKPTKWENVRYNLLKACRTEDLSENFYLFNDDFFIMQPWEYETIYDKDIRDLIKRSEAMTGGINQYSKNMRQTVEILTEAGLDTKCYAVHTPLLINKKKALEVLHKWPDCPMFRNLYGNYHKIGGVNKRDCKIQKLNIVPDESQPLLSTSDNSFRLGLVGGYIREHFPERSRYEA